jgi:hypothetical protein
VNKIKRAYKREVQAYQSNQFLEPNTNTRPVLGFDFLQTIRNVAENCQEESVVRSFIFNVEQQYRKSRSFVSALMDTSV